MSAPRMIRYQGRSQSIAEWARELGIPYRRIYNRLDAGLPLDKVFSPTALANHGVLGAELTVDGTTAPLREWARKYGLRRNLVEVRLAKGWSVERALKTPARRP